MKLLEGRILVYSVGLTHENFSIRFTIESSVLDGISDLKKMRILHFSIIRNILLLFFNNFFDFCQ